MSSLALLLAGCASNTIGPERDLNDPTNSLVFTYMDMQDVPTGSYQLATLEGSSFLHGDVVCNFPAYGTLRL